MRLALTRRWRRSAMVPSAYVPFPSRNASHVYPHRLQEAGHAAAASASVTRLKATAIFRSCLPAPDLGLIPVSWVMSMHTRNKHRLTLVSGRRSRNAFGRTTYAPNTQTNIHAAGGVAGHGHGRAIRDGGHERHQRVRLAAGRHHTPGAGRLRRGQGHPEHRVRQHRMACTGTGRVGHRQETRPLPLRRR